MVTTYRISIKSVLLGALISSAFSSLLAQNIQSVEMTTESSQTIKTKLGTASLIQLPVEPIGTHVGDPANWLIEKNDRYISVKPTSISAKDTNLSILTHLGTLNFILHPASQDEISDQMIRVNQIIDDSKPISTSNVHTETLSESMVREIQICQNYYALKIAQSPLLRQVDQFTKLKEDREKSLHCVLLQTFRFHDTGHVVLHFTLTNKSSDEIRFDQKKSIVSVSDTLFSPIGLSLGAPLLRSNGSTENFIILDGSNGLSPKNDFKIHLFP